MLTTETAATLLGGVRKKLPNSPQTPKEILEAMKAAASNYYHEAIATNCHTFIEFTGLINEYIKICERNLKQRGVDFTKTSVHTSGEAKLQIESWELDYINDKLRCIFPDLQLIEVKKTFRAFLKTYLEEDSWLGDLARDSFSTSLNWTGVTVGSLRRHMKTFGCCDEALEALATVAKLYEQNQQCDWQHKTGDTCQS